MPMLTTQEKQYWYATIYTTCNANNTQMSGYVLPKPTHSYVGKFTSVTHVYVGHGYVQILSCS